MQVVDKAAPKFLVLTRGEGGGNGGDICAISRRIDAQAFCNLESPLTLCDIAPKQLLAIAGDRFL